MLLPFVWRDIREQYAGSFLGIIWSLIQPLVFILLYWWVFSKILQIRIPIANDTTDEVPFIAYLLSGLLPWFAFQDGVSKGANAVITRRDMVKKIHFPIYIFPLSSVIAAFISNAIGFSLFLVAFFVWKWQVSGAQLAAIAVLMVLQTSIVAGLSLLLSAITVYLRDMTQVIGILLMAVFYSAPILYPLSLIPDNLQFLVYINPFTVFAEAYHDVVLRDILPNVTTILSILLFAVIVLFLGSYIFKRLEPGFADVL